MHSRMARPGPRGGACAVVAGTRSPTGAWTCSPC